MPRAAGSAALVALCLALGALGIFLGLRMASPGEYDTNLGRVSVRVTPHAYGQLDAYVPLLDWGVRLRPFDAPMVLHVEPRTVDRETVVRAASGDPQPVREAERDLREAIRRSVLRSVRFALGAAAVLALMLGLALAAAGVRRRVELIGAPALVVVAAAVLSAATIAQADRSFREERLDEPTFYARGAELPQLLGAAERARRAGDSYTSKVEAAVRGFASLLSAPDSGRLRDTQQAILASDLHNNTVALGSLRGFAEGRTVYFAGDFGNTGARTEARALVPRITRLGRRVVAVSGNHDSTTFMRSLARRGATVLTRHGVMRPNGRHGPPVATVDGMVVAGFDDPREWHGRNPGDPRRIFSFSELPDPELAGAEARRELGAWFDGLPQRPDIVLIHQNGLAQSLARSLHSAGYSQPLMILTGHDHRQHVTSYGPVTVVNAGTVGASGLYGVGKDSVGLADLHFAGRSLQAADLIAVEPVAGAAQARRVVITPCAAICER